MIAGLRTLSLMSLDTTTHDENENLADLGQNQGQKNSEVEVAARYKISPLSLTVFKRENENGTFYESNLQRAYTTDGGDSFDYSGSLRPKDMRKAARLYEKAADDLQGFEVDSNPGGGQ